MNKNTYNEEYIVAYLDGELQAGTEIKAAVKADADLAVAAMEHTILQRIFRSSANDSRFQLSAETDKKTVAALREALRTSRGEVRLPSRAVDAPMVRTPRMPAFKELWFKRSAVGFALALLLGAVFFMTNTKDVVNTPQVAMQTPTTAPVVTPQAPEVQTSQPAAQTAPAVVKNVNGSANSSAKANATRSEQPKNIAATVTPTEPAASNPADVMISRRFAKLLKDTRVVEITQQDRM